MDKNPDLTGVASTINSDERLTKTFINQITEAVDGRVREREIRRQWQLGVIFTAVALIGVTGLTGYIEGRISSTVATHAGLDRLKDETRLATVYQGLVISSAQIASSTEFSREEKAAILASLEDISESEEIRRRPDFPVVLERIVDAFASADLSQELDEIVSIFGKEARSSQGVVVTLVKHYGQRLVGSGLPPVDWEQTDKDNFKSFSRAAKTVRYPESALPWEIAVAYLEGGEKKTARLDALVQRRRDLQTGELAAFYTTVIVHSKAEWFMRSPTTEGEEVARVFSMLRKELLPQMTEDLRGTDVGHGVADRIRGVAETLMAVNPSGATELLAEIESILNVSLDGE